MAYEAHAHIATYWLAKSKAKGGRVAHFIKYLDYAKRIKAQEPKVTADMDRIINAPFTREGKPQ
jgi:hypothetical protein